MFVTFWELGGDLAKPYGDIGILTCFDMFDWIVTVYNLNSWITIPMTRVVGKIYKSVRESKEIKGATLGCSPHGRSAPLCSVL